MTALVVAELRQRIRGKRWWILLALWVLALYGLVALTRAGAVNEASFSPDIRIGAVMFGSLVLFVLGLACLIVPSLTSTSINTERDRGTLAVLQSTLLRPRDIVVAKFLAGLAIAIGFIVATLPLALWSFSEGGVEAGRAVIVYLILVLMAALLLLVGLAASAIVRRPALSAVAAYGLVFLLTIGTPILFALSLLGAPEVGFERQVGWRWVILAPNPFVVLADAAPRSEVASFTDPLEGIRDAVRESRRPPTRFRGGALPFDPDTGEPLPPDQMPIPQEEFFGDEPFFVDEPVGEPPALWPAGAAIDAALGLVAAYLARERLRVPARRLAPGERVA